MSIKKFTPEEFEKKEIGKLLNKLKLEKARGKKPKVYADKIAKLLGYYTGDRASLEALYKYDAIIIFADYLNDNLEKLFTTTAKKPKKRSGDIGKTLIWLFVLLFSNKPKDVVAKYADRVFENVAFPKKLRPALITGFIRLIILLSEFKVAIDEKYRTCSLLPDESAEAKIENSLRAVADGLIGKMVYDDWRKYFTVKKKESLCEKDQARLGFLVGLLTTVIRLRLEYYNDPQTKNKESFDYFLLLVSLITFLRERREEIDVKAVYQSIRSVIAGGHVSPKNVAELMAIAVGGTEKDGIKAKIRSFFDTKDANYVKDVFMPVVREEVRDNRLLGLFGDPEQCRSIIAGDVVQQLFSHLEENKMYNDYYNRLANILNKQPRSLSGTIEKILWGAGTDEDKIGQLLAMKGKRTIIDLMAEIQNPDYREREKHLRHPLMQEWMAREFIKNASLPPPAGSRASLDQDALRIINMAIQSLNRQLDSANKDSESVRSGAEDNRAISEKLRKEIESQKNIIVETNKERDRYAELLRNAENRIKSMEREHEEGVQSMKSSFAVNSDRDKNKAKHTVLLKIIALVDKLTVLKSQNAALDLGQMIKIIDHDLAVEGVEVFGAVNEKTGFREEFHMPVEKAMIAEYTGKMVVILERGYRYKDGTVIKRAIVKIGE